MVHVELSYNPYGRTIGTLSTIRFSINILRVYLLMLNNKDGKEKLKHVKDL